MKADAPFFSIVIPTYNRASLIRTALDSILAQTFTSYEVIVVDDGSTDHTKSVIEELSNDKIRYYWKENGERGAARNYGWERAQGKFVTFLDSDDRLYPDHFEKAYDFLNANAKVCVYAQAYEIKEANSGKLISKAYSTINPTINQEIIKGNFLSCFGVFIKNSIYKDVRFEEDRRFAGTEDWLLWLQVTARYPFYFNNTITGAMLEHENRSVLSFKEESLIFRSNHLKQKLQNDSAFLETYGWPAINKIYAHMLSYTSLHLAMSSKKYKAGKYWLQSIRTDINELTTRRSLAIIKKILLP